MSLIASPPLEDTDPPGDSVTSTASARVPRGWPVRTALTCLVAIVATLVGMVVHVRAVRANREPAVFFGVNVPDADGPAFTGLAGKLGINPSVSSVFVKLDTTGVTRSITALPAGVTAMVTLEPWSKSSSWGDATEADYRLADLAAGRYDNDFRRIAQQLAAADRPLYLRFAHEMNGSWYPWAQPVNGNAPGDFVRAWRHVHDVMAPLLGGKARWMWAPNIFAGTPANAPRLAALYPGDAYVDVLGLTGYSRGGTGVAATFCPTLSALQRLSGKPVVLAEIGVEGSSQASWLGQLGPFVQANPRIRGMVYFDTTPESTGASGYYRIDKNAAALYALRRSLDSLGVGGNTLSSKADPALRC